MLKVHLSHWGMLSSQVRLLKKCIYANWEMQKASCKIFHVMWNLGIYCKEMLQSCLLLALTVSAFDISWTSCPWHTIQGTYLTMFLSFKMMYSVWTWSRSRHIKYLCWSVSQKGLSDHTHISVLINISLLMICISWVLCPHHCWSFRYKTCRQVGFY